ncbi:hypothetical protein SAMN02745166_01054 [Prosthecobacter debontii]|uniref:Uncharacterized protein n=1 Tax=Prosthecobacter debontii TaxID=48467 RepID=A0A1T4X571_9BACT|nr:hypothetical protein [Prosthecobacter debontii]SKA84742.1 hypothetical protein SAMN02745166_01054 [Prosthecobacter debontii]
MMTTSHLLAFACGSLVASLLWGVLSLRAEKVHACLIAAARRNERQKAYAEGYQDRATAETQPSDIASPSSRP